MQLEALNNGVLPKFQDESEPFYICKTEWAARVIYRELIQPRLRRASFHNGMRITPSATWTSKAVSGCSI